MIKSRPKDRDNLLVNLAKHHAIGSSAGFLVKHEQLITGHRGSIPGVDSYFFPSILLYLLMLSICASTFISLPMLATSSLPSVMPTF